MSDSTHGLDPQHLLDQASWIRALARRLLEDEHAAEDVVQETWLAALQRGPARRSTRDASEGHRLRPWLAAVARNLALKKRRSESARRERERQVSVGESVHPDSEVEPLRQYQRLAQEVLSLADPYRSTLVLRFFDGLSNPAIARKRGVSVDAVRQHVSRGLRMLRARLDEEHDGDRAVWKRALLGIAGKGAGGTLPWTPMIGGVGLMGLKWIVGTLGIVGAVVLSVAIWSEPEVPREVSAPVEGAQPPAGNLARDDRLPEPGEPVAVRSDVPVSPRSTLSTGSPVAPRLSGQVVDAEGRGLAGAWIRRVDPSQADSEVRVTSDLDGTFELTLDVGFAQAQSVPLEVGCEGFVTLTTDVGVGSGLSLTLLRLPAVTGRVFDPDGNPAEPPGRVRLSIVDRGTGEEREFESELGPGGRVNWTGLPLGTLNRASALVRGAPELELTLARELQPQATESLEFRLRPGAVVVGTVLDDATGLPVEGASVWADGMDADTDGLRPDAMTDALGRFELRGVNAIRRSTDAGREYVVVWILASAPGYTSTPTRAFAVAGNVPQPYEFELRMAPSPCSIEGIVREGREPVRDAHVHATDSQGGYRFTQTDRDGRFELEELPAGTLALAVRKGELGDPGGASSARLEYSLETDYRNSVEIVLEGPAGTGLSGRVHSSDGSAAGVQVIARHHFSANGMALELDSKSVQTDGSGRYTIEGLSPGRYAVELAPLASTGVSWSPNIRRLDLARGQRADSIDFRIGPGVQFGGKLVGGRGDFGRYRVELHHATREARPNSESLASSQVREEGDFVLPPVLGEVYELRLLLGDRVLARRSVGPAPSRDVFISLDSIRDDE